MTQRTALARAQRGAVLITGLIMLLVMMLIGASAMRSALFEETMSANDMRHATAFQAAESAVELVLQNTGMLSAALAGDAVAVAVDLSDPAISSTGTVSYRGKGPAPGYEIGDEDSFANFFFDVTGTGEISAVDAIRRTSHGVSVIGPSGE